MMNRKFIDNLESFKFFMLSDNVPHYITRYCNQLNEVKWIWFYTQMIEGVMITDELEYLFYVLKWVLKTDFQNLTYEMYIYDINNPEYRTESLINDKYWDMYSEYYHSTFMEDMSITY